VAIPEERAPVPGPHDEVIIPENQKDEKNPKQNAKTKQKRQAWHFFRRDL
jgi:hypothetical protein